MGFLPADHDCSAKAARASASVPVEKLLPLIRQQTLIDEPQLKATSIVFPSRLSLIGPVRKRLVVGDDYNDGRIRLQLSDAQVAMALEEALANAVYHGNLELDSQLKEGESSAFWDLAWYRESRSPWKDRLVYIDTLVCPLGLWVTITDEGKGFDTSLVSQAGRDPLSMLSSGRGLIMINAFTNDLAYNAAGNSVTLAFYAERPGDQQNAQAIFADTVIADR